MLFAPSRSSIQSGAKRGPLGAALHLALRLWHDRNENVLFCSLLFTSCHRYDLLLFLTKTNSIHSQRLLIAFCRFPFAGILPTTTQYDIHTCRQPTRFYIDSKRPNSNEYATHKQTVTLTHAKKFALYFPFSLFFRLVVWV